MNDLPANDLYDTFLNVVSFAFIGLLVWLYFKDFTKGAGGSRGAESAAPKQAKDHD